MEMTPHTEKPKHKINFLKGILVVGIMVVLNLFFNYAIKLVYDAPQYQDFCPQKQVTIQPDNQQACVEQGGAWTENQYMSGESVPVPADPKLRGWCDLEYTCRQEFEQVQSVYNRNVFVALVILGIISIVAGFFLAAAEAVSLGLSLGGVLSLIVGSIRYWSDMDDYLRVIVLAVALGILLWLGIKKIRD